MNRIYKVIWSKVKHQYVVVSELAHRDGKKSKGIGRNAAALLTVLALTAGIGFMPVHAADVSGTEEQETEEAAVLEPRDTVANGITVIENEENTEHQNTINDEKVSGENALVIGIDNNLFENTTGNSSGYLDNSMINGVGNIFGINNNSSDQTLALTMENSAVSGVGNNISLNLNNVSVYGSDIKLERWDSTVPTAKVSVTNSTFIGSDIEARVNRSYSKPQDNALDNIIAIGHQLSNLGQMNDSIIIGSDIVGAAGAQGSTIIGRGLDLNTNSAMNDSILIANSSEINGITGKGQPFVVIGANNTLYGKSNGGSANLVGSELVVGSGNKVGDSKSQSGSMGNIIVGMENDLSGRANDNYVFGTQNKIYTDDGTKSNENGSNIVIGYSNTIGDETNQNAVERALIMGVSSTVTADSAIALGNSAKSFSSQAIAVGAQAEVKENTGYSVALGAHSKVEKWDVVEGYDARGEWDYRADDSNIYDTKGYTTQDAGNGVVSVGHKSGTAGQSDTRRIVNVERGRIGATSTDAVNGSQLRNYAFTSDNITWIDADKDGISETLQATWKDQHGIGTEFTTDFTGVASQAWVNNQIKNAGGSWNVTTSGNPNDDESTAINKDNTVDFSGVKYDDTNSNIIVSQETQSEDGSTTGTNLTFDLNDKVVLGDAPQGESEDKRITLDGIEGTVSVGTGISLKYDGTANIGAIRFNQEDASEAEGQHAHTITGLTNTVWDADNANKPVAEGGYADSTRAATEAQLQDALGDMQTSIEA